MKKCIFYPMLAVAAMLMITAPPVFAGAKNLTIALILWRGETPAERGLKDELKAMGYSVQYISFNAEQQKKNLTKILRESEPKLDEFDYIYSFGTTATKAAKTFLKERVPHIFNIVAMPVGAKIVKRMQAPGGNISGVTLKVPLRIQIENALQLISFKKLGFLFNPREKNSLLQRKRLQELSEDFQFELIDLRSPPESKMLEKNLQQLADKTVVTDAVYVPADSFMISNSQLIGSGLRKAGVKSIAGNKRLVEHGVLMGTVAEYSTLGKLAAGIIHRHQKGEKLARIPVQFQKDPKLTINKATADALNVRIPGDLSDKSVIIE